MNRVINVLCGNAFREIYTGETVVLALDFQRREKKKVLARGVETRDKSYGAARDASLNSRRNLSPTIARRSFIGGVGGGSVN